MKKNFVIGILAGLIVNREIYSQNSIWLQIGFVITIAFFVLVVISEVECVLEERAKKRRKTERMRRQLERITGGR
ncbi:MAG: hypothetical protein KBT34_09970 [Prevotella sp.]|nr:hypothetical protein [Candidatus Prevotella equi]